MTTNEKQRQYLKEWRKRNPEKCRKYAEKRKYSQTSTTRRRRPSLSAMFREARTTVVNSHHIQEMTPEKAAATINKILSGEIYHVH